MRERTYADRPERRTDRIEVILTIVLVVLVAGGLYCSYLFYDTMREIIGSSRFSFFPSIPSAPVTNASRSENLPDWKKKERINILLLGIDRREIETGPTRTDTMIVVSIDPASKSVSILSIPRDLWVLIPDLDEHNRVNAAHLLGDVENYPGGGTALAKKTVQYLLGIPIHYYVRVDFAGFEQIIDMLGGITIDVERAIHDEEFPDANYGYMTVDIPAGVQKMDGKTALQYARVRHTDSDIYRARRQQQVIRAALNKALSLDIPLGNIPKMLRTLGNSVDTDLSLSEIEKLAVLARDVKDENLRSAVIDESMTTADVTPQGWQVLIGDQEKIRLLVKDLFPEPASAVKATSAPVDMLIEESAKIEVQNGTMTAGIAERAATYLSKQGYRIAGYSNADRGDYARTVIIDYSNKTYTVQALAETLGVAAGNIRREATPAAGVDIRIILGADYQVKQ